MPLELPADYRTFIAAPQRYLPSNWHLFSHFGHDTTSLETTQRQLISEGMSDRWIAFGKTGDEDFLLFDTAPAHRGAVVWCDADDVTSLAPVTHYPPSFAAMVHKVAAAMAEAHKQSAERVLAKLAVIQLKGC